MRLGRTFPAISCGIYRFPVNLAVEIAIRETAAEVRKDDAIEQVIFACFDETVYAAYRRAAQQLASQHVEDQATAQVFLADGSQLVLATLGVEGEYLVCS